MLDRRSFIHWSTLAALGAGLSPGAAGRTAHEDSGDREVESAEKPLRILVLGNTGFLGAAIMRHALDRGHVLTLFGRAGDADLFPDVEWLRGDRMGDLDSLRGGRHWDAVVDTDAYIPRVVKMSAEIVEHHLEQYVFVSTMSVYRDQAQVGLDETYPVGTLEDETVERVTPRTYGPLKALCEKQAEELMPGRVAVLRPGLMVGPGDPTDRFTYWPARVHAGGEVMAPGFPRDLTSFIDVRDLAEWIVHVVEERLLGVFNASGPQEGRTTMGEVLEACRRACNEEATFKWVDPTTLMEYGVAPWSDMPCWIPARGDYAGVGTVSKARALKNGLRFRSLEETARDTLAFHLQRGPDYVLQAGLPREREAEILKAIHEFESGK